MCKLYDKMPITSLDLFPQYDKFIVDREKNSNHIYDLIISEYNSKLCLESLIFRNIL